jgi:chemotaxis protein CheC
MKNGLNQQQIELWSKIVSTTSVQGLLYRIMRHVAYNLSDMVGRPIKIKSLCIKTIPLSRLGTYARDPEAETVGIYLLISEDLSGEAVLTLSRDDAMYVTDWLLEVRPGTTTKLGELECSALAELGNLILSSFLNVIAEFTGAPLRLSPPALMVDMLATIFETIAMSAATSTDELTIIEADFVNVESDLAIHFWVLPDPAMVTVDLVKSE